jgi:hypothetical protein
MSGQGDARDDGDTGSWATESLPMSVRKEMLERELKKLGFRKHASTGSSHDGAMAQQQQQPQPGGDHPQAGGEQGDHSE